MRTMQSELKFIVPSVVNICVDRYAAGEISGRIYDLTHGDDGKPFRGILEMIQIMEAHFDEILFPQAAIQYRTFNRKKQNFPDEIPDALESDYKRVTPEEMQKLSMHSGAIGTFLTSVRYRQNATWQGDTKILESNRTVLFRSMLDLVKIISNSVEKGLSESLMNAVPTYFQ